MPAKKKETKFDIEKDPVMELLKKDAPNKSVAKILKNTEVKAGGKKIRLSLIISVSAIILLGAAFYGGYFLNQKKARVSSEANQAKETEELIAKVGKLIELPNDESPSIATVSDKEKLKEQSFFKNAENDDKVLIYVKAEKAILYRPSVDKIIEVAPVYMNKEKQDASVPTENNSAETAAAPAENQDVSAAPEETAPEPVKVSLFNGTNKAGLAKAAEDVLKEKMVEAEVVFKSNAKGNYDETIIVDTTGSHGKEAQKIAEILNGKVGDMPEGEITDSEVAVFLAK